MKDKLTIRQQNFARFLFEGHTQREAWGLAGYSTSYAPAIIDIHACQLAAQDKVKVRIAELSALADERAVAPVAERRELLSKIARHPIEMPVSAGHKLAAIAELNKMGGDYAPERKQVDLNVDVHFVIGKGYGQVVDSTAKELTDATQ